MTMTLAVGSFSLTIGIPEVSPFAPECKVRERVDGPGLTYSSYGTPIQDGTLFEPKHLWELQVLLLPDDLETLEQMYAYWLYTSPKPNILVSDRVRLFRESAPRKRQIVAGTSEATESGIVSYYAVFNADFMDEPRVAPPQGEYTSATIRLKEKTKTSAT